ncbi:Proline--tRNA ligase, chloroplastic/mitochondrial [Dichanthelium oligosanthes]|uniref:proline--tRNA ligase n=1 Tax=Dichanthelium oligosanthes TaxID=888268 RepID=A0A1E5WAE5_9POAL|nr:Proline--tRNA ligase, chloroplastic/mitochondrial [Dichanthelium oligosanthes]
MASLLRLPSLLSPSKPLLRRRLPAARLAASAASRGQASATAGAAAPAAAETRGGDREGQVTPRSVDFNAWYTDVIAAAELADYGPVRGTMVIRPYGYAIWEAIQDYLNVKFKETGHSNMYFPQFIPYSFIEKEASHVEGFSPELALVTIGGGKELEEKLVVRPTSETIVNHMFTKWIQSYRDLPLMINQGKILMYIICSNFIALQAMQMIDVYTKFAYEQAAIPVIPGRKSKVETFAGANRTYTIEAMMGDKKALQAGTSHNLGQNFSRAFGTQFMDENGQIEHVWQTSWAISTRFVGGIIMTHGDDAGLMLPPRIAPIQVIIVPIWKKGDEKAAVLEAVDSVQKILKEAGIRVKVDDSELRTPGWKFNHYEMKGIPVRIEIGPRDVTNKSVVVSRRDVPGKQGKEFGVSMEPTILVNHIKGRLEDIQASLLQKAITFRDSDADELKVKEETSATIRCYPFEQPEGTKKCFMTGNPAEEVAIFAKSY